MKQPTSKPAATAAPAKAAPAKAAAKAAPAKAAAKPAAKKAAAKKSDKPPPAGDAQAGPRWEFVEKSRGQWVELQAALDDLQSQMKDAALGARGRFEKHAEDLRGLLNEGERRLGEVQKQLSPPVEQLAKQVEFSWKALKSSVEFFKAQMQKRD